MIKLYKRTLFAGIAAFSLIFAAACKSEDDDEVTGSDKKPAEASSFEARITATKEYEDIVEKTEIEMFTSKTEVEIIYALSDFVHLNFEYPYKMPDGSPVMLSGTISISKDLYNSSDKKAWGTVLYNHYTIMSKDEAPTAGAVGLKELGALALKLKFSGVSTQMAVGLKNHRLIIVDADYLGFGSTADKTQYYCAGDYNARCSLEALLAARELLSKQGYTWDDYLLNMGYSQGGQTAMAVQKLVDTGAYDVKVSATFAGGGPYDLAATYTGYLDVKDRELDCAVVVYPILSFNEYHNLNLDWSQVFTPGMNEKLEEWFLSKQYSQTEISSKMKEAGLGSLDKIMQSDLLNTNSEISKKVIAAVDTENLTSGWTPKSSDRIYLFHSTEDTMVPYINCENMLSFFEKSGFACQTAPEIKNIISVLSYAMGSSSLEWHENEIILRTATSTHQDGGSFFFMDVIGELKSSLSEYIDSQS